MAGERGPRLALQHAAEQQFAVVQAERPVELVLRVGRHAGQVQRCHGVALVEQERAAVGQEPREQRRDEAARLRPRRGVHQDFQVRRRRRLQQTRPRGGVDPRVVGDRHRKARPPQLQVLGRVGVDREVIRDAAARPGGGAGDDVLDPDAGVVQLALVAGGDQRHILAVADVGAGRPPQLGQRRAVDRHFGGGVEGGAVAAGEGGDRVGRRPDQQRAVALGRGPVAVALAVVAANRVRHFRHVTTSRKRTHGHGTAAASAKLCRSVSRSCGLTSAGKSASTPSIASASCGKSFSQSSSRRTPR